jgi:hypothetical protein
MCHEFATSAKSQQHLNEAVDNIANKISDIVNRLIPIEVFTRQLANGDVQLVTRLINREGNPIDINNLVSHSLDVCVNTPSRQPPSNSAVVESGSELLMSHSNSMDVTVHTEQIPAYQVNNNLRNVEEMWTEWNEGLIIGPNGIRTPSIRYLEETYGAAWRKTEAGRKRFSRRKLFIQRLKQASTNLNLSEISIARKIERWRCSEKMSLDKLQKTLQTAPNQWGEGDIELFNW